MEKTKFKIGDRVQIDWTGNYTDGKIGSIVKKLDNAWWTVKIPDFKGHYGYILDGTMDKCFVSEKHLTKLPSEKESVKIEVKKTKESTFKFKPIVNCLLFILAMISTMFLSNHFGENSQENFQLMFKNIALIVLDIKCWLLIIWFKDFDF